LIVYLHGFNSSPQSHKARFMERNMAERGLAAEFRCPALPPEADEVMRIVRKLTAGVDKERLCYVGSSLGGFYATHLVESHGARAVLINPAIDPHVGLRSYLGPQKNLYSGETYRLNEQHLDQWRRLWVPQVTPQRYLLIVETGDEVLDYRRAVERYAGAEQVVVEGGDHSLQSFPEQLPRILSFAGY
jgi:predicted esterase YcpF (UPF0227 family)